MEIDISIDKESMTLDVANPHDFDVNKATQEIVNFAKGIGVDVGGLNINYLLSRMIRGVAGCEHGCPADAKSLVRSGVGAFKLNYIDGGVLSAGCTIKDNRQLEVKVFPGY
ncbi:hypothetical protein MBAV_005607 [Candidatus Magnetobacterium bavaricum]|uniref:Uncharacterized protein n=1 Tax=Candidatus Magnetobacterium bavaricum TaxID=29290 RepID=A0A0F3GJP8_9BACT|nr:hypothetical protein MBAV_005607 [Candidatus Magnetobacterium bavaricum]